MLQRLLRLKSGLDVDVDLGSVGFGLYISILIYMRSPYIACPLSIFGRQGSVGSTVREEALLYLKSDDITTSQNFSKLLSYLFCLS